MHIVVQIILHITKASQKNKTKKKNNIIFPNHEVFTNKIDIPTSITDKEKNESTL